MYNSHPSLPLPSLSPSLPSPPLPSPPLFLPHPLPTLPSPPSLSPRRPLPTLSPPPSLPHPPFPSFPPSNKFIVLSSLSKALVTFCYKLVALTFSSCRTASVVIVCNNIYCACIFLLPFRQTGVVYHPPPYHPVFGVSLLHTSLVHAMRGVAHPHHS